MTTPTQQLPTGATGRTIVVLDQRDAPASEVLRGLGVPCVESRDLRRHRSVSDGGVTTSGIDPRTLPPGTAVVLEHLGIAIVTDTVSVLQDAAADPGTPVLAAEPEVWVHAITTPEGAAASPWADTDEASWGLLATRVLGTSGTTPWDGSGIRVAILDTGVDAGHPDLADRIAGSGSFVAGEEVQDGNGHGTHVAGTIGGPAAPVGGERRYGVAPGCELLIGKVLSDGGSGTSGGVLEGMNWAIEQGAHVISMSLGSAVAPGQGHLSYYEAAARAALAAGSVIIAAAGNEGWSPVGSPANCPSVMAVAALDQSLLRAEFSCVALNDDGGEVNIAAPGVDVYSSWPVALGSYRSLNGTSMATPHVSGLAALAAQATGVRGQELWDHLVGSAQALTQEEQLVGQGLATAPAPEADQGRGETEVPVRE